MHYDERRPLPPPPLLIAIVGANTVLIGYHVAEFVAAVVDVSENFAVLLDVDADDSNIYWLYVSAAVAVAVGSKYAAGVVAATVDDDVDGE